MRRPEPRRRWWTSRSAPTTWPATPSSLSTAGLRRSPRPRRRSVRPESVEPRSSRSSYAWRLRSPSARITERVAHDPLPADPDALRVGRIGSTEEALAVMTPRETKHRRMSADQALDLWTAYRETGDRALRD